MRTFLFKDYQNMTNGKFLPSVTFEADEFGRHFFIDANFEFLSAPTFESGGYDDTPVSYTHLTLPTNREV